jgi:hypothetical protein
MKNYFCVLIIFMASPYSFANSASNETTLATLGETIAASNLTKRQILLSTCRRQYGFDRLAIADCLSRGGQSGFRYLKSLSQSDTTGVHDFASNGSSAAELLLNESNPTELSQIKASDEVTALAGSR